MKSEDVRPKICPNPIIIYDSGNFTIACGDYDGKQNSLLMRWNGKSNEKGYPTAFGNPMWFRVEDKLVLPILSSLLNVDNIHIENIVECIKKRK